MEERDFADTSTICAAVYPSETPYTAEELVADQRVFPEGQFVVQHDASGAVAGAHLTLVLRLRLFHLDDSWDTLTAGGTFADHDPTGHTLYGADLFVHPGHQHHGIGRALTLAARELVVVRSLWRMVGGSRMPGYGKLTDQIAPDDYVARVKRGELVDPVLTVHLHDGWDAITAIRGYLPHDAESAGWAAPSSGGSTRPARPRPNST
jgi:GNAT superfamily N-acetyltransferase